MNKVKLAIFASGRGSNAAAILNTQNYANFTIALIVVSRAGAPVIQLAESNNIPVLVLDKENFQGKDSLIQTLNQYAIDIICLAGFLWKIPNYLIEAYPNRIINIHPSLLPKYGGKGMYGIHVHQAVIDNNEEYSGITIHLVNEEYDKGRMLFQEKIALNINETPESLAKRILALEHQHYPRVIAEFCSSEG